MPGRDMFMSDRPFRDRPHAGRELARRLHHLRAQQPVVLGLPRGGVPVAAEVAQALDAPLDVFVVRKLGAPFQPELGIGAIAEGGAFYVDADICKQLGITPEAIRMVAARELQELERRVRRYRPHRARCDVAGRTVVLVDDGVARGVSALAAIRALRRLGPRRLVFATPIASTEAAQVLAQEADELVSVVISSELTAIGLWYQDFRQVDDAQVVASLEQSAHASQGCAGQAERAGGEEIVIPAAQERLRGTLHVPPGAPGIVLFAHGSGSSRFSSRNRHVAEVLRAAGLATLLFDLLTEEEEVYDQQTRALRFDILLLARRLAGATDSVAGDPRTGRLRIGYFGASTGAAAALVAAAERPGPVAAVVSRGGRPDLAGHALPRVRAPTLLLVGARDPEVLRLNARALDRLTCDKQLVVVPGATHLFEEPGALDAVAGHAARWFGRHLGETGRPVEHRA